MTDWRVSLQRIPRVLWGLSALQLLLLVFLALALRSCATMSEHESRRANAAGQRIVVDALTGTVSGGAQAIEPPAAAFDVAPEPEKPEAPQTPSAAPKEEATPPEAEAEAKPAAKPKPAEKKEEASPAPVEEGKGGALMTEYHPAPVSPPARGKHSLAPAPNPAISEAAEGGVLPKRDARGQTAASAYAARMDAPADAPAIAVLVVGLGLTPEGMNAALALPAPVSFSFSPYGKHAPQWAGYARDDGHEVWIDLPAQTHGFPAEDPGPLGVFRGLPQETIIARMHKAMLKFPGAVGVTLPVGQSLLEERSAILPVLEELRTRGLLAAVADTASPLDRVEHLSEWKASLLLATMVADGEADEERIRARFTNAEEAALGGGAVLVVVRAEPLSLRLLGEWVETLKSRKLFLIPASHALARR